MSIDPKKYRVSRFAITEKGLKKLITNAVKGSTQADWAISNKLTPQSVSAFLNDIQTAGLRIPEVLGYRPQVIYLPLDEDIISNPKSPRRVTVNPTPKTDATRKPIEGGKHKFDDRAVTKARLKAKVK